MKLTDLSKSPTQFDNAFEQTATISDSNVKSTLLPENINSKYKLNYEGIGEKPARKYEHHDLKVNDAFADKNEVRFKNESFLFHFIKTAISNSIQNEVNHSISRLISPFYSVIFPRSKNPWPR